jgi:Flp pilus assembly protein TadG
MRTAPRARRRSLLRDERGVSVIEFGFLMPVLAFMMLGISDLARGYSRKMALEQGVHRALEKASVGIVQTDYTFLKTEVRNALPDVPLSGIQVDTWVLCDTTRKTFDQECGFRANGQPEEISRYVKVTVTERWEPMFSYGIFGAHIFNVGADGKVPLSVNTSLRVQ